MKGAIFNYTRLTNCTCKFRRLATLYFVERQVGHKRGNTCNRGFNLQCNKVARQVEEKCCPYYRTFWPYAQQSAKRIGEVITVPLGLVAFLADCNLDHLSI